MKAVDLPLAFRRLQGTGCVLEFAVFEEVEDSADELAAAVVATLRSFGDVNGAALQSIGYRLISEEVFFGDWYDPQTRALIRVGDWKIKRGRTLHNPKLLDLEGKTIASGGGPIPEIGCGGQFAYAFADPPYGLRASPRDAQTIFNDIRDFMMPPTAEVRIADWSSERLTEVSAYFADGLEWWGVFLFGIYLPALKRLTIVAGSATD